MKLITTFAFLMFCACGGGSKSSSTTPTNTDTTSTTPTEGGAATKAKEGETCGDGMMGTPNMPCEDGLVCDTSAAQDPPAGAQSSGKVGTCKKPS